MVPESLVFLPFCHRHICAVYASHQVQPITSVCKWVANAVTRAAQDVESYDRSTEMESIGYSILGMSREKWNRLNKVSA